MQSLPMSIKIPTFWGKKLGMMLYLSSAPEEFNKQQLSEDSPGVTKFEVDDPNVDCPLHTVHIIVSIMTILKKQTYFMLDLVV